MSDSEGRRGRFTPLKRLSDDQLAVEAARGDDKAFALLFERLQEPLYRYCMSILGNPEEARDTLQNAMLKAYRALRGETREIAVRPWLYRIVRNESISALRGRRPLGELDEAVGVAAAGADVEAASRERLSDLVADLRSLPERQRSAIVLRELSGLDYEELGTALDISPNAARQTVFKARLAMQRNVEGRTAHCDEVRAAMSKSDGRFRRRRSIQAHLDRCPVCTEFATALERRPRNLAALFPPLPAGVAAAMIEAVSAGGAGAAEAGAGAAAGAGADAAVGGGGAEAGYGGAETAAAGATGAGAGAAATRARPRGREPKRRRGVLVPLLLLLLLGGGAVATALVLDDDGGGGGDEVATTPAEPRTDTGPTGPDETEPARPDDTRPKDSGDDRRPSDEDRDDTKPSDDGRDDTRPSEDGDSGDTRREEDCVERTDARGASPAASGYSKPAGRIEAEVSEDCVPVQKAGDCVEGSDSGDGSDGGGGSGRGSDDGAGSDTGGGEGSGSGSGAGSGSGGGGSDERCVRAAGDGLPITGLELGLIGGTALLLLGFGVALRRLAAS